MSNNNNFQIINTTCTCNDFVLNNIESDFKFGGKQYTGYFQLGKTYTYISLMFSSTGKTLNIGFGNPYERSLIVNTTVNNIFKSPNIDVWYSDYVVNPSELLLGYQLCDLSFNDDYSILYNNRTIIKISFDNLQLLKSYIPTDYYNFLYTRSLINPNEDIELFFPIKFIQNNICKFYDIEKYKVTDLILQPSFFDSGNNIYNIKLWNLINKYQKQQLLSTYNNLSFSQYIPNLFFTLNNYVRFFIIGGFDLDPNGYFGLYFNILKPAASIYSCNSPELFTMQIIMQHYFDLSIINNMNGIPFTNFKENDIFDTNLLSLLDLFTSILRCEIQLGVDASRSSIGDNLTLQYQYNYYINNNAVSMAQNILKNFVSYIQNNSNLLSWDSFNKNIQLATQYATNIDNNIQFKFSNGVGVGTYFLGLLLIHYNNILALTGFLTLESLQNTVLEPFRQFLSQYYYIKSSGPGNYPSLSPIEQGFNILMPLQQDLKLITLGCINQLSNIGTTNNLEYLQQTNLNIYA